MLKNGDTIRQTQSAFVLEDAIGQLINSSGSRAVTPDNGFEGSESRLEVPRDKVIRRRRKTGEITVAK